MRDINVGKWVALVQFLCLDVVVAHLLHLRIVLTTVLSARPLLSLRYETKFFRFEKSKFCKYNPSYWTKLMKAVTADCSEEYAPLANCDFLRFNQLSKKRLSSLFISVSENPLKFVHQFIRNALCIIDRFLKFNFYQFKQQLNCFQLDSDLDLDSLLAQ